jgi:hypothetical protein
MESQSNQVQEYTLEDIFARGVIQEDLSIQSIQNELHQTEIIDEEFKLNPFYISLNGGNLSKLKKYPFSQDVIVYYPLNSSYDENIHQRLIKKDYVFKQDFSYMRVSQNILNNSHHKFRSQLVSKEDLCTLFKNDEFNLTEIVVGLFELSLNDVQQYLIKYKSFIDFNQIMKISDLNKLYNVRTNLSKDILNLKHANYWTIPHNCMINLTENFTQREFQSKPPQVIKLSHNTTATPEGDSPMYPTSSTTRSKFHDMSMVLRSKHNNRQLFYSTPKVKLDRNVILNLYRSLNSDRDRYSLLNSLLISKDYCDLIVNNKDILLESNNIFEQYKGCFKYTMGYAWLSLSCEESLKLTSTIKTDRFVFDIETANKLPQFPFLKSHPKLNPYFTLCVNDSELTFNNQLDSIKDYDGYGVCDLATFKHRLNIFISGSSTKDIFTGLNWASYAVTGSLIPACLPKKSPLLNQIEKNMPTLDKDIAFKSYIDTYYPDSDIDIMSNESSTYKFIDRVQELYEKILTNISLPPEACQYEIFKTSAISLTERFFEATLKDFNTKNTLEWDIAMYEANLNDIRVRYYLYEIYVRNKLKNNQQIILSNLNNVNSNRFLRDFMEITPFEKITFYYVKTSSYKFYTPRDTDLIVYENGTNFVDKDSFTNILMKISEGIRFKMSFKTLSKPIEIFQSHKKDFFSVVAKFHLGCVRAYYQDTVYMLPSCISAMMIGLNMDYKYVHGIKNPIQIINKYEKRGFGTILNKTEAMGYAAYNEVNPNEKIVLSNTLISKIDEFKKLYPNKLIDHTQISHINSNGYPNNVSKSFIDFMYETN